MLVQAEPAFFLTNDSLWHALQCNRLEIASLLHSNLEKKTPLLINQEFRGEKSWLEYACKELIEKLKARKFTLIPSLGNKFAYEEFITPLDTITNLIFLGAYNLEDQTELIKILDEILKDIQHVHPCIQRNIQICTEQLHAQNRSNRCASAADCRSA